MTYKQQKLLEILEAYLLLKGRMTLDKYRNDLFKLLDKHSAKLDKATESRVAKFSMAQYTYFRDLTENHYDIHRLKWINGINGKPTTEDDT
jgi:hypothetical protein